MDRNRTRFVAAAAALFAALLAAAPARAVGFDAASIRSEADYASAFDRETDGRFGSLLAQRDPKLALEDWAGLVGAFSAIEDALYAAASPHANTLPGWWAKQLMQMGLAGLPAGDPAIGFFTQELASGDFDRVVHAYYLLSLSRAPLVAGDAPTPVWIAMIGAASGDPENRFWIPLVLAEAKMLRGPAWDLLHTRMADETESVRERVGRNAQWLGARIPRVLGVETDDPRVAHLRIREAREAALNRVSDRALLARGGPAAYAALEAELIGMETGAFESRRLLAIMQRELPLLLETYGLPDDPDAVLEALQMLCRGRGGNRMVLWDAADDLARLYEAEMAFAPRAAEPKPPPSADEIVAMGDGGWPLALAILADTGAPEPIRSLLLGDAIPSLAAASPPPDASAVRRAIRDAQDALGYPPDLRAAGERALEALGPEESSQAAATRETLAELKSRFEGVRSAADFDRAFDAYREASAGGHIPKAGLEADFVVAFAAAAARVLEAESQQGAAAAGRLRDAQTARRDAAAEIEAAEAAILAANAASRQANADLAAQEARQHAAIEARNKAVIALNEATENVKAATAAGGSALESARNALDDLEERLEGRIESQEKEAHAAVVAAADAEQRAFDELKRAHIEDARAKLAAAHENEAIEAERIAAADVDRSAARFSEGVGRLIAGLGFAGIRAQEAASGAASGAGSDGASAGAPPVERSERIATVALLLESDRPVPEAGVRALEHDRSEGDPPLRALAALALARAARLRSAADPGWSTP